MFGSLLSLRAAERRPAWIAFAFLTSLIASHSMLETARDALFLAHLPAARLPWVYLSIALLSLIIARWESKLLRAAPQGAGMLLWTAVAALGTFGFWLLLPAHDAAHAFREQLVFYGLYVWTGVIAALVLFHFWSQLAAALSVTQAKRLYPLIGSGSVIGALLGSGFASVIARYFGAAPLLLVAAVGFSLSAFVASVLVRFGFGSSAQHGVRGPLPTADPVVDVPVPAASSGEQSARIGTDTRLAVRNPYVRRVGVLLLASTTCLTVLDYVFKSAVAASVPQEKLGEIFGSVALGLNTLSLVCQLLVAPWLLKHFDLRVALATLPALLTIAGSALVMGFGMGAALFGKAADGALRYSLHRTATELLYLPLPDSARPRIKAGLDALGQRGGQALASLLILSMPLFAGATRLPAWLLAGLAIVWLATAWLLRKSYVALLRTQLRERNTRVGHPFPELDVASLETLVTALDSVDDNEVLAALDILERERKARLVPALILHHPSEAVVLRALGLFARARRNNVIHVVDRVMEHASVRVRCDAIAVRTLLAPDPAMLRARLEHESAPEVRATLVVHLIASGAITGEAAKSKLAALLSDGTPETRAALATATAWREDHMFAPVLLELARASEMSVQQAALFAMTQHPHASYLPALIDALSSEQTRSAARQALLAQGELGFASVRESLSNTSLPRRLRWELPRTLSLFEPERALPALLSQLTAEPDGMVRYRIIRALEALAAKHPRLHPDRRTLRRVVTDTVARAYRHLDERLCLERGAAEAPARRTPGHALLLHVLQSKERNAIGRLLHLLGLAYPEADFATIRQSLRSPSPKLRAASVELLGTLLWQPLREAVLGLVEDRPDLQRLAAAGPFYQPARMDYTTLLSTMLTRESPAIQDFTAYHIAELRLHALRPQLQKLVAAEPRGDLVRALSLLTPEAGGGEPELAHAD